MLSAEEALGEAFLAAFGTIAGLNGVFTGPQTRATAPWAELGETSTSDWSAVGISGRELRSIVRLVDRLDTPDRINALAAAATDAIAALPRDLTDWRIASVTLTRSRTLRDRPSGWAAVLEHRIRLSAS